MSSNNNNNNNNPKDFLFRSNPNNNDNHKSSTDDSNSSSEDESIVLKINQKFAKDYEKKKRAEELTKHEKRGLKYALSSKEDVSGSESSSDSNSSSSSEEEDEDAVLLTDDLNYKILQTVHALRHKHQNPEIYDPNTKFFDENDVTSKDISASDKSTGQNQKSRKKHFKDVIREQILEDMDEEELDENGGSSKKETKNARSKPNASSLEYDAEQRMLRAEFLKSNNDGSSDDDESDDRDLLTLKKRHENDEVEAQKHREQAEKLWDDDNPADDLVDPRGEVSNANAFLRDFVLNKKWIDPGIAISSDNHQFSNLSDEEDDEEEVERMDRFESQYNFRFEESAPQIVSYARGAAHGAHDDSLRRKDETRKNKRQLRQERKAAERKAKEEKLRRLKNAKRDELQEKIRQIEEAANFNTDKFDEALLENILEGDFDEEKFNKLMEQAYNEDFYEKEDEKWKNDCDVKEGLREEIDTDGIEYEDNVYDNDEGYDQNENDEEDQFDHPEDYYDDEAEEVAEQTELSKKLHAKMLDELYKLDYEDMIGDLPCRFKYKEVEKNRFGLTPEEILFSKDAHLNQFVSLKKLVPYKEGGDFNPGAKKRRRFRDMVKEDIDGMIEKVEDEYEKKNPTNNNYDTLEDTDGGKKKRRRQKKGKKGDKRQIETDPDIDVPMLENKTEENQSSLNSVKQEPPLAEKKKKRKRNKPSSSNNAREKKTIAVKVEGVSSSRLASYGF